MFRNLSFYSNKSLTRIVLKLSVTMFGLGMFIGFGIVMAGMASKGGNPEEALKLVGVTIVFLLTFIFLYVFMQTRVIPEIEKRLNQGNKI